MVRAAACFLGAVLLTGCGGASHPPASKASPQAQARAYTAGIAALRSGDYELARDSFRAAGSYHGAPRLLAEALQRGSQSMLAQGRAKLAQGHPRAAVVFAELAASEYSDHGAEQQDLLRRAQAAQSTHHQQQLQAQQAQRGRHPPVPGG
jgi:outer membrane protein assembly factor BamD (BamD/ComL family)